MVAVNYFGYGSRKLPREYAALTTGTWAMAVVAFVAGLGTINVGSTSELAVRVMIAIGAVAVAGMLFRSAVRFDEPDAKLDVNLEEQGVYAGIDLDGHSEHGARAA